MMERYRRVLCFEEPWFPSFRALCSQDCKSLEPDFPRVLVDQMDGTMTKGAVVPRSPKSYIPLFERWVMDWNHEGQGTLT